jgi:hypothetical protein
MEDDNGLELSLGLSFGGSSTKSKCKNASSSETRTEEGDRGSKLVDDFKNYFRGGPQKQDSGKSDSVKPQENFFSGLPKTPAADAETSINLNGQQEPGTKRKMFFDEMINQKKREREVQQPDSGKTKASHISITTEDGSTADNEDVAESEVDGSTSRFVSHHDDGSKRFAGGGGFSDPSTKEVRGFNNGSSENEYKLGNFSYSVPFSMQSVNIMNVPYPSSAKDSNTAPIMPGHPISGMMQVVPAGNGERSGTQPVNNGNMPMMFGYSPVQLPMLDKDNSWGLFSQSQPLHPVYAGRGAPNLAAMQAIACNPAEAGAAGQLDGGTTTEQPKSEGKQPATDSRPEDDSKGSSLNNRQAAEELTLIFHL